MMPRLLMHTSLSTGGRFNSSNVGMTVLMARIAIPTRPCWMKALQRKRPIPGGAMAKLHSLVDSNSIACLSFITLRTSSIVCCEVSGVFETGAILPSILSAGGKPAVMKRSEPFCLTSRSSSSWINLVAVSRSMVQSSDSPLSRRTDPCSQRVLAPRQAESDCGGSVRSGIDPSSACPPPGWSGSSNTSARPCFRG